MDFESISRILDDTSQFRLEECRTGSRENKRKQQRFRQTLLQELHSDRRRNENRVSRFLDSVLDGTFCPFSSWFILQSRAHERIIMSGSESKSAYFNRVFLKAFTAMSHPPCTQHNFEVFFSSYKSLIRGFPISEAFPCLLPVLEAINPLLLGHSPKILELNINLAKRILQYAIIIISEEERKSLQEYLDAVYQASHKTLSSALEDEQFGDVIALSLSRKLALLMLALDRYWEQKYSSLTAFLEDVSANLFVGGSFEEQLCPFLDDDEDLIEFFTECCLLSKRTNDQSTFLQMFEYYYVHFAGQKPDYFVDLLLEGSSLYSSVITFVKELSHMDLTGSPIISDLVLKLDETSRILHSEQDSFR